MFGSDMLDVLIGLVVVFLMLSLIASAVREGIESVMKTRAVFLERGIRALLDDKSGAHALTAFYEHPLIKSLTRGEFRNKPNRWLGAELPTYIPARNFAVALMDLVSRPTTDAAAYVGASSGSLFTIDELRASANRLPSNHLRRAMLTAIDSAYGDVRAVQTNLEAWFDSSMDRVSGWYKRRTHLHLFVIGFALTASLNVNTFSIIRHLSTNRAAREALVRRGQVMLEDSAYINAVRLATVESSPGDTSSGAIRDVRDSVARALSLRTRYEDITSLELPIGWEKNPAPTREAIGTSAWIKWWAQTFLGLMMTAVAVTLGAPFWFDLLNKMMVIRSTVKPREKSQEEGSEDKKATSGNTRVIPSNQSSSSTGGSQGSSPATTAAQGSGAQVATAAAGPFEPRRWVVGDPDEGLL